jgi:hypothetical protein
LSTKLKLDPRSVTNSATNPCSVNMKNWAFILKSEPIIYLLRANDLNNLNKCLEKPYSRIQYYNSWLLIEFKLL